MTKIREGEMVGLRSELGLALSCTTGLWLVAEAGLGHDSPSWRGQGEAPLGVFP